MQDFLPKPRTPAPWLYGAVLAAAHSLLFVLMTWPLPARLSQGLMHDLGDPLLNLWTLGWSFANGLRPCAAWFDAPFFFPYRHALAYSEHLYGAALLAWPVWKATGSLTAAYHAAFALSFVLGGVGMGLWVRHLTDSRWAGWVGGVLFLYCPYLTGERPHLQSLMVPWMPWVMWLCARLLDRWSFWAAALAAVLWVWQCLCCGYYAVFFTLYLGFLLLLLLWKNPRLFLTPRACLCAMLAGAGAALLAPFFAPYLDLARDVGARRALSEAAWFGPGLEAFFTPSSAVFPGLATLGLAAAGLRGVWPSARGVVPPGTVRFRVFCVGLIGCAVGCGLLILVAAGYNPPPGGIPMQDGRADAAGLLLVLAGAFAAAGASAALRARLCAWVREAAVRPFDWRGFLLLSAVFFALCALGPVVTMRGREWCPGPYRLLFDWVPGFSGLRVPSRMVVLAQLSLSALAGYGVVALLARCRTRGLRALAGIALTAACTLTLYGGPVQVIPSLPGPTPADSWLAARAGGRPVVYLPQQTELRHWPREARVLVRTLWHRSPVVNGYSGSWPFYYWESARSNALFPAPDSVARLRIEGVGYAVFDLALYSADRRAQLLNAVAGNADLATLFVSGDECIVGLRPLAGADEAEILCGRQIARDPGWAPAWRVRGLSRIRLGRKTDGLRDLRRADSLWIAQRASRLYWSEGYDRAFEEAQKALALDPDEALAQFTCGLVLRKRGKWEEALPYLDRAAALDPENWLVYSARARVRAQCGDAAGAKRDELQAVRLRGR